MLGDLHGGGPRELVGLAGDEGVEGERRIEPGALAGSRAFRASRAAAGVAARAAASTAAREHQAQAELAPAGLRGEPLDARGEAFAHQLAARSGWARPGSGCRLASPASGASGRIQVLNCCAGSSCSSRRRQVSQRFCIFSVGPRRVEILPSSTCVIHSETRARSEKARAPTLRFKLTMRRRARSNTALFRTGSRWRPSGPTNLPRRGARGATDFWCAAARPADARCCATGAQAAGARLAAVAAAAQALRARMRRGGCGRKPNSSGCCDKVRAAASGGIRFISARRDGGQRAARHAGHAQARCARGRAQPHQALHPRGVPAGARGLGALDLLVRPPYGIKPSAQMIARLRELFGSLKP